TSMDWYVPSPDGRLVGVSLSKGGSEMGDVHLFESESGRQVGEVVERVNGGTAGGDMAWLPDGSGFYYTRYPRSGERKNEDYHFYQQLWFHAIGTPADSDRYVAGRDFPRTAEIKLDMDQKTGRLLIVVQYGDSGRMAYFILHQDGRLASIAGFDDQIVEAVWGKKDDLFLISLKDAPRGKIVRLSLAYPVLNKAATIVPEGPDALIYDFESKPFIAVTESHLFAAYQLGGPSEIRVFGYDGRPETKPEQLPVSSVSEIAVMGNDELLFKSSSYLQPSAWYRLNAREASVHKTALFQKSPVDFSDTEVVREFATSKDGTKVPVNIIRPKGVLLNGDNPVWLGGYGGYGISRSPNFGALRRVWIEQGGVVAVANIRGGGEYGEAWHRSGALLQKQNGFDDFAAVMQYLIDSGYTRPERLALTGGSNGGLLMGAMITQHPNLFKATVSFVGIYDMIRSELTPNGEFNIPEYGTVKDPAQFRALFAYSPYHHVEEGTAYPAVLFMTGANDPRVDPMHSRKMTARLQAATSSANPILLRTSSTTGHGGGTPLDEQIKEDVDMFAFLFNELGVDYKPVK
ncbi:MAG TPA: prolyl oligopeptidase family serine peptidase, partial [bacterium]